MTEWVKRFGNMTLGEMKETEAKKKKNPRPSTTLGLAGRNRQSLPEGLPFPTCPGRTLSCREWLRDSCVYCRGGSLRNTV